MRVCALWVHRNTEQAYWEYVKELAEKEGVDPQDEGRGAPLR